MEAATQTTISNLSAYQHTIGLLWSNDHRCIWCAFTRTMRCISVSRLAELSCTAEVHSRLPERHLHIRVRRSTRRLRHSSIQHSARQEQAARGGHTDGEL